MYGCIVLLIDKRKQNNIVPSIKITYLYQIISLYKYTYLVIFTFTIYKSIYAAINVVCFC